MSTTHGTPGEGLSRREALKRGAVMGGALVWAVPVVQTVGMNAALAQEPSPCTCGMEIAVTCSLVGMNGLPEVICTVTNTGTSGEPADPDACCLNNIKFELTGPRGTSINSVFGPVCPGVTTSKRIDIPAAEAGDEYTLNAEAECDGPAGVVVLVDGPVSCTM